MTNYACILDRYFLIAVSHALLKLVQMKLANKKK